MSHPIVHPMELAPPLNGQGAEIAEGVRMSDALGTPGTPSSLTIRLFQFVTSVASLIVMASASDFGTVAALRYFVAAVGLQCLWTLFITIIHIYALLVGRRLRNFRIACFFTIGDEIFSTLTLTAASASATIAVHVRLNVDSCAETHCRRFEVATALAFISWFPSLALLLVNLWTAVKMKKRTLRLF